MRETNPSFFLSPKNLNDEETYKIMKQEEKELLLQDLCTRLPYGVKCDVGDDKPYTLSRIEIDNENGHLLDFIETKDGLDMQVYLSECRPYLLPLSSMTEKQKKEYNFWKHEVPVCYYEYGDIVEKVELLDSPESLEYLIENHFDYRGLIGKGLALDATGLNIY